MENKESHFTNHNLPTELSKSRVLIWGLGLMGGSLAMALSGKTEKLFAVDPDVDVVEKARQLKIFDKISSNPEDLLAQANFIILAAPLDRIPELIAKIPKIHPGNAVIIDLGSTKTEILLEMDRLPGSFFPIGGHPMCGKEVRTLENAVDTLFLNSSFALIPLKRTTESTINLCKEMILQIGASPVILDPSTHDKWVAAISHLPYLAANSLSRTTPLEAAPLVGPGYKSTTRLAVESIDMMISILSTNRNNVLPFLQKYCANLEEVKVALENEDWDLLTAYFREGSNQREAIMESFNKGINL